MAFGVQRLLGQDVKKGDYAHWLIKSEPFVYAWSELVKDKRTAWEGVRNFEARNAMRVMSKGDLCLYYHSNEGKEIVGVAKVVKEAYPDTKREKDEEEGDWSMVDVAPVKALASPVGLDTIKKHPKLSKMLLVTRSRISVVPVLPDEFAGVLALGKTKL